MRILATWTCKALKRLRYLDLMFSFRDSSRLLAAALEMGMVIAFSRVVDEQRCAVRQERLFVVTDGVSFSRIGFMRRLFACVEAVYGCWL
jgi:hypothetical protein